MNRMLLVLASLLHLIPHPFGVTPVGALALYSGAYGPNRFSWCVPLLPLGLAALVFGFYDPVVMLFVFAGFALSTLAGRLLLRRKRSYSRFSAAIVLGAGVFFLVSNFSIWLVGFYPPTLRGLLQCYLNGLPYLLQAMLADTAYCFVLFGLHAQLDRERQQRAAVPA